MSADADLRRALALAQGGDLDGAVALLAPHEAQGSAQLLGLLGQLRLQQGDLDGALDVLVPGLTRAERAGAHRDVVLLGLALTQVLVAAHRGLEGLRVLVKARQAAEALGSAPLLGAVAELATVLAGRVPQGADALSTRVGAAHFSGLLGRAAGDLGRCRTQLLLAWAWSAEGVAPALRAEVGLDLVRRQVADGDPAWRRTHAAARAAAVDAGDADLVHHLDALAPPVDAAAPLPAAPLERARAQAERGALEDAVETLRGALRAGGPDELSHRMLLAELLQSTDPDAAVAVLAPGWSRMERDGDGPATVALGLPMARALAAAGQHQAAVRVLLVARRRTAEAPALRDEVLAMGAELGRWLPPLESLPPDDAEAQAVVAATGALLAALAGAADAGPRLAAAWRLAPAAGERAIAQIGLDMATLGRSLGLPDWAAARDRARVAAERTGDTPLLMLLEAL